MKIFHVADVHIGNHRKHGGETVSGINKRCQQVLDALKHACDIVAEQRGYLLSNGDLFDVAYPSPQIIAAAQRVLETVPAVLLKGNHEGASSAENDNALAPLAPIATVVERPQFIRLTSPDHKEQVDLLCVPFMPGPASEWFPEAVRKLADEASKFKLPKPHRLLEFHLGVEDNKTPSYLRGAPDSIKLKVLENLMQECAIDYAFCGNWHEHRHWYVIDGKRGVMQVGTLAPTGWDNAGSDGFGKLVCYDTQTVPHISVHEIPGPRFIDVNGPSAVDTIVASLREEGNSVYARWKAGINDVANAQEELREWQDAGLIQGWETRLEDDDEAEEASLRAAQMARTSQTLEEALAAFVAEMPLPEGTDRNDVLVRARDYLGI